MKSVGAVTLLMAVFLTACGMAAPPLAAAAPVPRTLAVFAAASLTQAFGEMGRTFEAANPGVKMAFNFAGSQTLVTQIQGGAPADIFASASGTNMDALVTAGFVDKAAPQVFLTNILVVVLPPANPANVQSLKDLSRPGLKLVLGDVSVPAGKYARQILGNMSKDPTYGPDFGTKVLANVVSNETDVKQVVAKAQLGEADAGIVYISDAVAAPTLKTIAIPAGLNVVAKYPIAPLAKSTNADLAARFIAYVISPDGQATLKKWGFTPIQ